MNHVLLILAAGIGSRFGGLKQLHPLGPNGEFLLEYTIYDAIQSGIDEIVLLIRPGLKKDFEKLLMPKLPSGVKITFAFQQLEDLPESCEIGLKSIKRKKPWGTGHAVWSARKFLNKPFIVVNADDFYGRDAFVRASDFFRSSNEVNLNYAKFGMIGFSLKKTLSENGGVSRGICNVNDSGLLVDLEEVHNIQYRDNRIFSKEGMDTRILSPDAIVSMNFWMFSQRILPFIEEYMVDFMSSLDAEEETELLLPDIVKSSINMNQASVEVLKSDSDWHGVTYFEDASAVSKSLKGLISQGAYPECLWKG